MGHFFIGRALPIWAMDVFFTGKRCPFGHWLTFVIFEPCPFGQTLSFTFFSLCPFGQTVVFQKVALCPFGKCRALIKLESLVFSSYGSLFYCFNAAFVNKYAGISALNLMLVISQSVPFPCFSTSLKFNFIGYHLPSIFLKLLSDVCFNN